MKGLRRSLELTKMSLKVGLKELTSSSLASRIEQARTITESLSQLKGAAMKVGQLLSIDIADYFPPEAAEILAQLQSNATADSYEVIESVLREELGAQRFNQLLQLSQAPIATASIAQVHTGFYKNQRVALKVQHRGVADSIDSDLKLLKKLITGMLFVSSKKMDFDPLFNELESMLKQEIQFEQEISYLARYRENLKRLNQNGECYFAPVAFPEMSTSKVLTMTFEEGVTLGKWLQTNPTQEQKERLAHRLLNLYIHEFYHFRLVQTDPNFSNFLIRQQGEEIAVVLLDFGATREYSEEFVQSYIELLRAVAAKDPELTLARAIAFGLIDGRESEASKELFLEVMRVAAEPFITMGPGEKFDFGDQDYSARSVDVIRRFAASLKFSPPPYKIIFLHRKLGGLFSILKKLNVQLDLHPYWHKMIG
jgi:aarF domain-containing kinase